MEKPDDIPQDIWDAATAADNAANDAFADSVNDPFVSEAEMNTASVAVIARAIMAERIRQRVTCAIEHGSKPSPELSAALDSLAQQVLPHFNAE